MPQVFKIGTYWVYFWANENIFFLTNKARPVFPAGPSLSSADSRSSQGLRNPDPAGQTPELRRRHPNRPKWNKKQNRPQRTKTEKWDKKNRP